MQVGSYRGFGFPPKRADAEARWQAGVGNRLVEQTRVVQRRVRLGFKPV